MGIFISCMVTALFLIVTLLAPRRFSSIILLILAVSVWILTITELLDESGMQYMKLATVFLAVSFMLVVLGRGVYMLVGNIGGSREYTVGKSLLALLLVGCMSAGILCLTYFTYVRLKLHRYPLFRRSMTTGDYLIDFGLVFALFLLMTMAATLYGFRRYVHMLRRIPREKDCDYLILHGDGRQTDVLSNSLTDYLERARYVYRNCCSMDCKFLIAGASYGYDTTSEAELMKQYLTDKGEEKEDIIIEEGSSEAAYALNCAKKHFGDEMDSSGIMLTKDYLTFRMSLYAKKSGLDVICVGYDFWENRRAVNFFKEYIIAMFWYKWIILGWLAFGIAGIMAVIR